MAAVPRGYYSPMIAIIDDMHNGDHGPYISYTVIIPAVLQRRILKLGPDEQQLRTWLNMSHDNKAHFESLKEESLILTGIGDEIYSIVDACKTAHEMWEAIERLQQVATIQVNVQFLQQLQPEWSRSNELCAERIAKNVNPLALVATAQPYQDPYYQTSKSHTNTLCTNFKSFIPYPISMQIHDTKQRDSQQNITPSIEST
ncbi:hypothetical protein Tco_0295218 [Tanacetum coccineum]